MVMKRNARSYLLLILSSVFVATCDSSPLVAPIASTIEIFADATTLKPGESTTVEALVVEEAGTLVHDGTVVTFNATLGTVDPEEARTTDGVARTTFTAGSTAGTAVIVANSGGAVSGEDQPNEIQIVISN
jgi:hypothetical protein